MMSQRDPQTQELDGDSSGGVPSPRQPANRRRPAIASVIAALLVMALGVATFAVISTHRTAKGAAKASATATAAPLWSVTRHVAAASAQAWGGAAERGGDHRLHADRSQ